MPPRRLVGLTLLAAALALLALPAVAAPALKKSARISSAGLGPVKIGMTEREVERAAGRRITRQGDTGPGGCSVASLGHRTSGLFTGRLLARIYVESRRHATRSGIRKGDAESEVRATYGDELIVEPHKYTNGSYLKVVDGNRAVVMETDGARVTSISTGRFPEIDYVEACS